MAKTSDHGITIDEEGHEQPMDKDRAQKVNKTEPGHMPPQPIRKEDEPKKGGS